jgi:hypothetical protein
MPAEFKADGFVVGVAGRGLEQAAILLEVQFVDRIGGLVDIDAGLSEDAINIPAESREKLGRAGCRRCQHLRGRSG